MPSGAGQPLDRLDRPAVRLARGHEAGADLLAVEPDRARAAVARVAADLGPGQPEVLAQDVDQAPPPVGDERVVEPLTVTSTGTPPAGLTRSPPRPPAGPASAPRPAGRRPARARRRSAPAPARCPRPAPRREACAGAHAREARASSAASRRATGEHAPTATRASATIAVARRRATAATATIEITRYAREPSFANVDRARRPGDRAARRTAVTSSSGRRSVAPVARSRTPPSGTTRAPRAADASSTAASSASRFGIPSAAGEALTTLPAHGPGVLDLAPADRARAAARSPSNAGGSARLGEVRPGRQRRRSASRRRPSLDRRAARRARVMSSTGRSIGPGGVRGVDVRAAARRRAAARHRRRAIVERVLQPSGSQVRTGAAPGRRAATLGRHQRQDVARRGRSRSLRIPVERVEDQVVDAAQRLDLAPDPLGDLPRPRPAGRTPASTSRSMPE